MRISIFLFCTLVIQLSSSGQSNKKLNYGNDNSCVDSSSFRIYAENGHAWIEIQINDKWETYALLDDVSRFSYECQRLEIDGTDSKELIIKWSNSSYGTGGGIAQKGIQIWDLDSAIKLFDEVYYCSDEQFGRHGAKAYLINCHKHIEVHNQKIIVAEKTCETEWNETDHEPDPNCPLTTLDKGVYIFSNGELKRE